MKNVFLTLLFLCVAITALKAQQAKAQNIRFVFGGEEDKPHGTIVISVDNYVKPIDRGRIDVIFGRCIVTNKQTFDSLKQYISQSRYVTMKTPAIADTVKRWGLQGYGYYSIFGTDGSVYYLSEKSSISFFEDLRYRVRKSALDQRVVTAL